MERESMTDVQIVYSDDPLDVSRGLSWICHRAPQRMESPLILHCGRGAVSPRHAVEQPYEVDT